MTFCHFIMYIMYKLYGGLVMNIFLGILLLLAALFLIVAVLLQNGKSKGTGVVTGGAETFFGKTKGQSIDKKLSTVTSVIAVIFVVIVLVVYLMQDSTDTSGLNSSFDGNAVTTTESTGTETDEAEETGTETEAETEAETGTTEGTTAAE